MGRPVTRTIRQGSNATPTTGALCQYHYNSYPTCAAAHTALSRDHTCSPPVCLINRDASANRISRLRLACLPPRSPSRNESTYLGLAEGLWAAANEYLLIPELWDMSLLGYTTTPEIIRLAPKGCTCQLGRFESLFSQGPTGHERLHLAARTGRPWASYQSWRREAALGSFDWYPLGLVSNPAPGSLPGMRGCTWQLGRIGSRIVRRSPSENPTGNTRSVCSIRQLLTCTVYVPGAADSAGEETYIQRRSPSMLTPIHANWSRALQASSGVARWKTEGVGDWLLVLVHQTLLPLTGVVESELVHSSLWGDDWCLLRPVIAARNSGLA
eukprot:jgi/Tetstr1/447573/TSEL_034951.t1